MSLEDKYNLYLKLLLQDQHGFIESDKCDSMLFTGLVGCDPKVQVDIYKAFDIKRGFWLRRPKDRPCYDCEKDVSTGSASSISRDMLVGLAWYAYHNRRLDISEQVVKHAMKNFGVMGKGAVANINIMPPLFATFCWISYALGGPARWWAMWVPADVGAKLDGFQAHLQTLHIMLRRDLQGWLLPQETKALERNAKNQPMNPLFKLAIKDYVRAESIIKNEKLWPKDRLPTKGDRKEPWLPERDYGDDWMPAKKDKAHVHSGGDFVFLYWLLNKYRK